MAGEIRVAVLAVAQTQQVDETWQMVREGGKWKWSGSVETRGAGPPPTKAAERAAMPEPTPTPERPQGWLFIPLEYYCWAYVASYTSLPPGFQVRGREYGSYPLMTSSVTCEVAEQSSGYELCIPYSYGTLGSAGHQDWFCIDLNEPTQALNYPLAPGADVHIYSIGKTVTIPSGKTAPEGGSLTLNAVTRTGEEVLLDWTFVNASGGYEAMVRVRPVILGDDGIDRGGAWPPDDEVSAGPGQKKEFQQRVEFPSGVRGLYLLVTTSLVPSWEWMNPVLTGWAAGYVFELGKVGLRQLTPEELQFVDEAIAQFSRLTSCRARGEGLWPSDEGQTLKTTIIVEWKAPAQYREVTRFEDGTETEMILSGDKSYYRTADGVWHVVSSSGNDLREIWAKTMMGGPFFSDGEVKETSIYTESIGERDCRVYRLIQTGPEPGGEWTIVLWVDIHTHLPVKFWMAKTTEEGVTPYQFEVEYQEFDVPITITVPDVK